MAGDGVRQFEGGWGLFPYLISRLLYQSCYTFPKIVSKFVGVLLIWPSPSEEMLTTRPILIYGPREGEARTYPPLAPSHSKPGATAASYFLLGLRPAPGGDLNAQ